MLSKPVSFMFDVKWIRDHPDAFDDGLRKRSLAPTAAQIVERDAELRACQTALQEALARRNKASKEIGAAKARGEDAAVLIGEVATLKRDIQESEERERTLVDDLNALVADLPNQPADDVPVGPGDSANEELRRVGQRPDFDVAPKEHFEIGEALGLMDFEAAARMSGARFVVLTGALARLERALGAFMLELHTAEFGYQEVAPPILVRDAAAFGTGNLPKFADDLFGTRKLDWRRIGDWVEDRLNIESNALIDIRPGANLEKARSRLVRRAAELFQEAGMARVFEDSLWLIPTAEVPLANLVREKILNEEALPLRFVAHTPCFRAEAGAAAKDTRGMIRLHQFNKVELVSITHPDESDAEHERMTGAAEEVLQRLELPYRVVVLSTGDMGFAARKTYDIEVWLPGQNTYREISSCSNCGDFQARRMNARFRSAGTKGTRFVHTLNGSGLAVGRTLIALLENYQQADGSVVIPKALRSFMGGLEVIARDG